MVTFYDGSGLERHSTSSVCLFIQLTSAYFFSYGIVGIRVFASMAVQHSRRVFHRWLLGWLSQNESTIKLCSTASLWGIIFQLSINESFFLNLLVLVLLSELLQRQSMQPSLEYLINLSLFFQIFAFCTIKIAQPQTGDVALQQILWFAYETLFNTWHCKHTHTQHNRSNPKKHSRVFQMFSPRT